MIDGEAVVLGPDGVSDSAALHSGLSFVRSSFDCGPQLWMRAGSKAGAVAFSRTGDPDLGEYGNAVILARFGETPSDIEPATSRPAMASH
jgi:hypothetical protein